MKRHIPTLITLLVLLTIVSATTVLAYTYRATYSISENGTASYTMLPVRVASNNQWMVDNGFIINADALDTRIETLGGLVRPHMVADDKTLTAVAVPSNSQTNLYFTTGNSLLSAFDIITGRDGYITTSDAAALEPGANLETAADNWTVDQTGWVDTTAGSDKDLVDKEGALRVCVIENETIRVLADSENITYIGSADAVANIYSDNWSAQTFTTPNYETVIDSIWLELGRTGLPGTLLISIRNTAGDLPTGNNLISTTYDGDSLAVALAFKNIDLPDYVYAANTVYAIVVAAPSGDGTNLCKWRYDNTAPTYTDGRRCFSQDIGVSWNGTTDDHLFITLYSEVKLTATSVSSGEHTVKTTMGIATWANGNLLDFDGTAGSVVDLGASYNGSAKFYVSIWFKPHVQYDNTLAANTFLFNKTTVGGDYFRMWLRTGAGHYIECRMRIGGADKHLLNIFAPGGAFLANTWYHALFSISSANGGRARLNNGVASTDADTTAMVNGGTEFVGSQGAAHANGIDATIAFITVGTDDLTLVEEAYLYTGYVPGDETDLWYMDEGESTTIYSYGSSGNDGTAGATTSWTTGSGLRNFVLSVDGTEIGHHIEDIPNNSNSWVWARNNVLPYSDNISISVDGTQQLLYEPVTYIVGTSLPDRAGAAQNGVFTWGANPSGVTVSLGSLVSSGQPAPGFAPTTPAQDILPEVEVSDWFVEPDVSGTLLTNPMRPFVTILSDSTTLTERQAWVLLALVFILLVTVSTARAVRGHHFITGLACGASFGGTVALTIFPLWSLVFIIGMLFAGLKAERTPSL